MKDKSVINNLIWSYCIVWLPILLACFIISEYAFYNLRKKEEEKIHEQIYQTVQEMADKYRKCIENGVALAANKELKPEFFLKSDYSRYEGRQIIKEIYQYDMEMHDIFLYYGGDEIYAVNGLSKPRVYLEKFLACTEDGVETAFRMLESEEGGIYFLEDTMNKGYLCFHVPVQGSSVEKQSVNYVYSLDFFLELLEYQCGSDISRLELEVQSGTLYLCSEENVISQQKNAFEDTEDEMVEIEIPLVYQSSGSITVRYLTDALFQNIKHIHIMNYVLIVVGALFSLILTICLSNHKARRIRRLEEVFDIGNELPDVRDEYQYLRTLIRNVVQESDRFLTNEAIYKRTLLQQNTRLLFCGGMDKKDEMTLFLHMSGVELCEEYFCVCAFMIDKNAERYRSVIIGDLCYSQEVLGGIIYYSLIELPNPDQSKEVRQSMIREKAASLEAMGAEKITIAVSRVYSDITRTNQAYREVFSMVQEENKTGRLKSHDKLIIQYWSDRLSGKEIEIPEESEETDQENPCAEEQLNQERFSEILAYIDENYGDCNLTAESVAEYARLNKVYLSRLFKQKMNMTYMDYLTGLRMKNVERLLVETDKPITDICSEVGYIDVSSFRRKFKKIYGMSVSEYRQMKRRYHTN